MERLGRSKRICLIAGDDPGYLLIQPMDERDVAGFEHEAELIAARTHEPFALAGLVVEDWNRDLSPWEAPPVFGKEPFGNGAAATLAYIAEKGYSGFDGEGFCAFYASKGWKVGNQPMRDWKRACVTWQKRREAERPTAQTKEADGFDDFKI